MGFARLKDKSYGFQDDPSWLLWLPNMLANGELQLGVWAWSAGGPGDWSGRGPACRGGQSD